jgi:hypothetical protein
VQRRRLAPKRRSEEREENREGLLKSMICVLSCVKNVLDFEIFSSLDFWWRDANESKTKKEKRG